MAIPWPFNFSEGGRRMSEQERLSGGDGLDGLPPEHGVMCTGPARPRRRATRRRLLSVLLAAALTAIAACLCLTGATRQDWLNQQLMLAVIADDPVRAAELLDAGADANGRPRWPPVSRIKLAARHIVRPPQGEAPPTMLVGATWGARYRVVGVLLAHGAKPDARGHNGVTPLGVEAGGGGDTETLRALQAHGADPNAPNKNGVTPLMQAAHRGKVVNVEMLLQAGGNANTRDRLGQTALTRAAIFNAGDIARSLLAHGADPNTSDADGRTPLMHAAEASADNAIVVLLTAGADPTMRDRRGATAAQHADDPRVVGVLRRAEAKWRAGHRGHGPTGPAKTSAGPGA
jgi:hypothetical protein